MKLLFDQLSGICSRETTKKYSTSFSLATRLLSPTIRQDIYNIYGFVRFADEIVDSFHDYDKEFLLDKFEEDLKLAISQKISLNPILNAFQETVHNYGIGADLYMAFLKSMRMDLHKTKYFDRAEFDEYIYGSADVVGLMCLKVFVKGDQKKYDELKESAMSLGSAFQKVNFLRDLRDDYENLERSYFPNVDLEKLDETTKRRIVSEIESDFKEGLKGILKLPVEAKFGVYTAYVYYLCLLNKLKKTPPLEIRSRRIRVPNYQKAGLLAKSYVSYRLNLIE
jgi:phytoene/squalene synthetase